MAAAERTVGGARSTARVLFAPPLPRPLRPDPSEDLLRYRAWAARREAGRLARPSAAPAGPEIAVLIVVDRPEADALRASLRAMVAQTSSLWHLSLTVCGTPGPDVDGVLSDELGALPPGSTTVHALPPGHEPADCASVALEASSSPACTVLDVGDVFAPDAIALLGAALVDADVAYGDEDRIGVDGLAFAPALKPDWSPELLLSWRYTGRPLALRVAPIIAAGGIRTVDGGDWEHDLLLRVTERTARVAHVAEVLCHRRDREGTDPGPAAVAAALERRAEAADVVAGPMRRTWRVRRHVAGRPRVTAIVPFRDSTRLLRACADSVLEARKGGTVDLDLVLVDNGSSEPETETLVELLATRPGVVVRRDDRPFNWAALNNAAAAGARGDVLLFLNDDVEARTQGWLELLTAQAMRAEVGAAGARLVYPGGNLQHAGIVLGLGGITGHVLAGLPGDRPGYLGMAAVTRDVSAVTGACLATRHAVFERLEGFDESLGLDFNDVDYCLRARGRGLRVVYEAGAELVHHESPTRGTSGSAETARAFMARWGALVDAGDPFLNAHLSRLDFSAALEHEGSGS